VKRDINHDDNKLEAFFPMPQKVYNEEM